MYEEAFDVPREEGSRSAFGDLQRESERFMKVIEVLGSKLGPILLPERKETTQAVPMAAAVGPRSDLGGLVEQYRKCLEVLDRIIKRVEL